MGDLYLLAVFVVGEAIALGGLVLWERNKRPRSRKRGLALAARHREHRQS